MRFGRLKTPHRWLSRVICRYLSAALLLTGLGVFSARAASQDDPDTPVLRTLRDAVEHAFAWGTQAAPVDLECQVTFAGGEWGRIWVEAEGHVARVNWHQAEILGKPVEDLRVGDRIRVIGTTLEERSSQLNASHLEYLGEGEFAVPPRIPDPPDVMETQPVHALMGRRFRLQGRVVGVLLFRESAQLLLDCGGEPVLVTSSRCYPKRFRRALGRRVVLTGIKGVLRDVEQRPLRRRFLMMRGSPFEILEEDLEKVPAFDSKGSLHNGVILLSDLRERVVVQSAQFSGEIRTPWARMLEPGQSVLFGLAKTETGRPEFEYIDAASTVRPDRVTVEPADDLSDAQDYYRLVTVEGRVLENALSDRGRLLKLDVKGRILPAVLPPTTQGLMQNGRAPLIPVVGDQIRLQGVLVPEPLSRPVPGLAADLCLDVPENTSPEIISAPLRLELAVPEAVRLAVFIGLAVTAVGAYSYSLKRAVCRRTEDVRTLAVRLRSSYESIPEGLIVYDHLGQLVESNVRARILLEASDAEFSSGQQMPRLLAERAVSSGPAEELRRCLLADSRYAGGIEIRLRDSRRILRVFSSPVTGTTGEPAGRLWLLEDMTERRLLEQECHQSQKMNALGRLAGGIAHEFNNLLTAISGNVELATTELAGNSQATALLGNAQEAVDHAAVLTGRLLGFSRRSALSMKQGDAADVVDGAMALLNPVLPDRVVIRVRIASDLPLIWMDRTFLQQAVMNLCLNARDALGERGGFIDIVVDRATHSDLGPTICISIIDNGPGIAPNDQDRVFEPFFTTKAVGQGTGLGLSMVLGLVEQHGGRVVCDSQPGIGTTMSLHFPIASPDGPPGVFPGGGDVAIAAGLTLETPSGSNLNAPTVLVVDDDVMVRRVAEQFLQQGGYRVLAAESGRQALDMLNSQPEEVDVVLLDMKMPDLSGRETYRRLRRLSPDLPAVFCSGYSEELEPTADDGGNTEVVLKPFTAGDLHSAVAAALKGVS